jgi:hypothetical protein
MIGMTLFHEANTMTGVQKRATVIPGSVVNRTYYLTTTFREFVYTVICHIPSAVSPSALTALTKGQPISMITLMKRGDGPGEQLIETRIGSQLRTPSFPGWSGTTSDFWSKLSTNMALVSIDNRKLHDLQIHSRVISETIKF